MNPRLRAILIAIGLVTLVIVAIVLVPRGVSIYYQSRGGQHVDYVLRSVEGIEELVCEPLPESQEAALEEVERGVEDLQQAVRFNRRNSQAYYQLGKAYCLLGEPQAALENYQEYTELRPDNPLGYIGLGFAYEADCLSQQTVSSDKNICEDESYQVLLQEAWKDSGLDTGDFLANANSQYNQSKYMDALFWYSLGYRIGAFQIEELSKVETLNWAISAALSDGNLPRELINYFNVSVFEDQLQIEVEDMIWLRSIPKWDLSYGDRVNKFPTNTDGIGTLYWEGRVISFIQIPNSGDYKIIIRGINSPPAPIKLLLEDNFKPLGEILFSKGDKSTEEISLNTFLNKGFHIISLNFMNNQIVDGIDRDAHLDFIRIE